MKKLCPKLFLLLAPSVFVLYVLVIFLMFRGKTAQAENIANQTTGAELECETLGKSEPETEATQAVSNTDKTETSDWMLVLVNFQNPIESNPNIEFTELSYGVLVDRRMYPDLQKMMDDARAEGLSPLVCSGFRSRDEQQSLYNSRVDQNIKSGMQWAEAKADAAKWVAYPGTSEHHTGLAVDIVSVGNQRLDSTQENTAEQRWLMENSWKYGFILRYPKGKTHITGIYYEPWHYRYVGKEAAEEIFARNITLEEYISEKDTEKMQN